MASLDEFRNIWQQEILEVQPDNSKTTDDASIGELHLIGSKCKCLSDNSISIPPSSSPNKSSYSNTSHHNLSFTIGIRMFNRTSDINKKQCLSTEPTVKKQKTSNLSLIDELIRDIDEITEIPFFNISIPREIAFKIFDYLSIKDLYSCLQVCKAWNSLSCDELLWLNIFKRLKFRENNDNSITKWKERVKDGLLLNRKLINNFKNHQCRTTKLTYNLGIVLTCAKNNRTTIAAGYSNGMIRTWSIESIINSEYNDEDDDDSHLNIPEIIYESNDTNRDLSCVKSVGFLKNDIYAVHDDGLLEVWMKDKNSKPYFAQNLMTSNVQHVANDDKILCVSNRSGLFVWNFDQMSELKPQYQMIDFFNDLHANVLSMTMSSYHSVPISIVACNKSLWCISLSNVTNRFPFYSIIESDNIQYIPLDIHNDEPLVVVGLNNEIKLFDLTHGRCNIISTNYKYLPGKVNLIRADQCPIHEFIVAYDNYQISIFDRRQKEGGVQHFYDHSSLITTLQMDTWKFVSTDESGFVRLWDRRMHSHALWQMNPQHHPVQYCSFDKESIIFALTPYSKRPDMIEYQINPEPLSGHIYFCNFNSDVSTKLDDDLKICTSSYDAPKASKNRIALYTPYDIIE